MTYWTESFQDDEGLYRCTFCLDERRDLNGEDECSDCPEGDHLFHPVVRQEGHKKAVIYNEGDNEDHCSCCHLHLVTPSPEEVAEALASIRHAITRDASSRSVVSPSGQRR